MSAFPTEIPYNLSIKLEIFFVGFCISYDVILSLFHILYERKQRQMCGKFSIYQKFRTLKVTITLCFISPPQYIFHTNPKNKKKNKYLYVNRDLSHLMNVIR